VGCKQLIFIQNRKEVKMEWKNIENQGKINEKIE